VGKTSKFVHISDNCDLYNHLYLHSYVYPVQLMVKFSYEERLQRMDLPSLEYRRLRGDVIETCKYLHGQYSVDVVSLLMRHDSKGMTTRGHSLKLQKRECHSNIRQNFFSFRVVNMWNSLPEEVVTAESVNCFKGRYDRWKIGNKFKL